MSYKKQEIIDKCEASLKGTYKNNNGKGKTITPSTFYAADFINYRGKTTDTKEYFSDIIAEFVRMVFFGLTDTGHFVAYIPDSWDNIIFGTTGLDDFPIGVDYGHLTISY